MVENAGLRTAGTKTEELMEKWWESGRCDFILNIC